MATKQTAVEWLGEQIIKFHKWKASEQLDENKFDEIDLLLAIRKAKAMHKEQIKDAVESGENNIDSDGCYIDKEFAEQYYNETYGK